MTVFKKSILLVAIISINIGSSRAQCWVFFFDLDNWSVNTGINSDLLASVEFGKGWEFEYGAGLEWALFNKVLYVVTNIGYVHQFLNDNSPNHDIFTSNPDKTEMHSRYLRARYGLKFRVNWWDKKEDRNSYLVVNYNYITNYLIKETTDLHHGNVITSTNMIYSPGAMWGKYMELGYSWKINERIKWDCGIYFYYPLKHSSPSAHYIDYKTSLGVNSGIYLSL